MAGFEPTYEGIKEMILRYQYFLTCDKSLQIFLKEKGKLSLKEMTKVIWAQASKLMAIQLRTMRKR